MIQVQPLEVLGLIADVVGNVYEPLLFVNGSDTTTVIPWLAQSYTASADLRTYNFTLRQGITFADGEPMNASSVYFTINRLIVTDASTATGHGVAYGWILQQLFNTTLSSFFSGHQQVLNSQYVNNVLAENVVQVTGPYTFTIHVQNPYPAFPFLFFGLWGSILAPNYVMQQDVQTLESVEQRVHTSLSKDFREYDDDVPGVL